MAYAPLDEHFDEHPKFEDLELDHYGLMACAISYCNRNLTDGRLSMTAVRRFGKSGKGLKLAKDLGAKKIWRQVDGGWEVVGFLDHNTSREAVLAKRELARRKKENYRKGQPGTPPGTVVPPRVPASVPGGQISGQPSGQPAGHSMDGPEDNQRDVQGDASRTDLGTARPTDTVTPQTQTTSQSRHELGDPPKPPGGDPTEPIVLLGSATAVEIANAYVAAISTATDRPYAANLRIRERDDLTKAVNVHLRGDGTFAGAAAALASAVAEWVDAYRDKPQLTAGWAVRKFVDWLNAEREVGEDEPPPAPRESGHQPVLGAPMTDAEREVRQAQLAEIEAGGFDGKFMR
jgi:hypothetical protein